jgi:hypothetical protein
MDLAIAIISALIGMSAAFFLSLSFYDMLPNGWTQRILGRSRSLRSLTSSRYALTPRSIRRTPLD